MDYEEENRPRHLRISRLLIVIVIILAAVMIARFYLNYTADSLSDAIVGEEGEVTTITEATLEEVFEISELSTVDYAYNAIAYAYDDDENVIYYVAYEGSVTAGVDFTKIDIAIDDENKEITLTVPECEIQETIVDFGSMEYIFVNEKYDTETVSEDAYKLCTKDLAARAADEEDLLSLAGENALAAVDALVSPWIEQLDDTYTVVIQQEGDS